MKTHCVTMETRAVQSPFISKQVCPVPLALCVQAPVVLHEAPSVCITDHFQLVQRQIGGCVSKLTGHDG